jgi:hypothetical protein
MKTTVTVKRATGVEYTPQEFRKLKECIECGKATPTVKPFKKAKGQRCEQCRSVVIPHCEMCDVLLRNGKHVFYTYDIKNDHREQGVGFKVSKELVREFEYELDFSNPLNDYSLCKFCTDWEMDFSTVCGMCDKLFPNTKEHYKEHGNLCKHCIEEVDIIGLIKLDEENKEKEDEPETTHDRFEREGLRPGRGTNKRVQAVVS